MNRETKKTPRNITILIVEDEVLVAKHIHSMVLGLGYEAPPPVSTAWEAIQKTKEISPHLVLMDIRLKGSMDGVAAAEFIRENFHIPVVYLTAYADELTLERAKVTEPFGYLLKPFEERELYSVIEMALYKHEIESKIKERERWLATVLKSIGDAVIATDKEGLVTFMNPSAESLLGQSQKDCLNKRLQEILAIVDEAKGKRIKFSMKKISASNLMLMANRNLVLLKEKTRIPVEASLAFSHDEKGEVVGSVLVLRDITERKRHEQKLAFLAIHDSLTGLPNRVLFEDRLTLALIQARRKNQKVAVLLLDLDHFKKVNDTLGHSIGDALLQAVAARLVNVLRKGDTIARMGGDEFMVLLSDINVEKAEAKIAQRILQAFHRPFEINDREISITTSIGIALFPDNGEDADTLTKNADIALYRAKEAGRNNCQYYSSGLSTEIAKRLE